MLAFFPAKVINFGDHFVFWRTNSQPWFLDFNFGGTENSLRVGWPTVCLSLNEFFFVRLGWVLHGFASLSLKLSCVLGGEEWVGG